MGAAPSPTQKVVLRTKPPGRLAGQAVVVAVTFPTANPLRAAPLSRHTLRLRQCCQRAFRTPTWCTPKGCIGSIAGAAQGTQVRRGQLRRQPFKNYTTQLAVFG